MERQAFFELIDKWMNGIASESEVQALMNYYYSFQEDAAWEPMAKARLEAEMELQLLQSIRHMPQQRVVRIRYFWVAAAAVVVLMLGLGWLFRSHRPAVKQIQLTTLARENRQLQLADGTQVWLSPSSTLQYPEKFNGRTREVNLHGEAFFSVAKGSPFIVHSGQVETRVLGTSFTVQAYDRQPEIGVTVLTGKVAVAQTIVLPNQRAVFNKQSGSLHTDSIDAGTLLLRREGLLKYRGAPLLNVVQELGYYYNVTITIEGPTADCFYFGEFNTNSQLEKALNQLCLTLNATLVKAGNTWIIRKSRC